MEGEKKKGNYQGEISLSQRYGPIPTLLLSGCGILTGMGNILLMWLLWNLMEFPVCLTAILPAKEICFSHRYKVMLLKE